MSHESQGLGFISAALAAVSIVKSYGNVRRAKRALENQKTWAQQEVLRLERLIQAANSEAARVALQQERLGILAKRDLVVAELGAASAALDAVVQSREMQRLAVVAALVGVVAIAGAINIVRKKRRQRR
jgi:hypothetical protein